MIQAAPSNPNQPGRHAQRTDRRSREIHAPTTHTPREHHGPISRGINAEAYRKINDQERSLVHLLDTFELNADADLFEVDYDMLMDAAHKHESLESSGVMHRLHTLRNRRLLDFDCIIEDASCTIIVTPWATRSRLSQHLSDEIVRRRIAQRSADRKIAPANKGTVAA